MGVTMAQVYYDVFPAVQELVAQLLALDLGFGGIQHTQIMRHLEPLGDLGKWLNACAAVEIGCYDPDQPEDEDQRPWEYPEVLRRTIEVRCGTATEQNLIEGRRRLDQYDAGLVPQEREPRSTDDEIRRLKKKLAELKAQRQQVVEELDEVNAELEHREELDTIGG